MAAAVLDAVEAGHGGCVSRIVIVHRRVIIWNNKPLFSRWLLPAIAVLMTSAAPEHNFCIRGNGEISKQNKKKFEKYAGLTLCHMPVTN